MKFRDIIVDNLPEILTGLSVGGVITSDALFIRAAKLESKDGDYKHYILPTIVSGGTLFCIIASNRVSNSQKASIAAGGSVLATKYINYRKRVKEELGEDEECKFESLDDLEKVADETRDHAPLDNRKALYYIPPYGMIFWAEPSKVINAELKVNKIFTHHGEVTLEDFLYALDCKDEGLLEIASELIWVLNYDNPDHGIQSIDFNNYSKRLPSGRVCNYIEPIVDPMPVEYWELQYGDPQENLPFK